VLRAFPDIPEALTDGADEAEVLRESRDALAVALGGYVHGQRDIPRPSAPENARYMAVPPLAAAKVALYQAMRRKNIEYRELARLLGISEAAVRRLADPDQISKIERVQAALAVLDVDLVVEDAA
jgi:antitoxin HicB